MKRWGFAFLILVLLVPAADVAGVVAQEDNTLYIVSSNDIATLDPAIGYDLTAWLAEPLVYRGLVGYSETGELIPVLAESYEASEDGLSYTFTLREGLKFSNGRDLTADDVKYTFERFFSPDTASPGTFIYEMIAGAPEYMNGEAEEVSGVQVVDDRTVQFTLSRPEYTFLIRMALPFTSIVAREGVEEAGADFARKPLGAGPFTLESWESGQRAVFVRNPNYYREGYPKVDRIVIDIGIDPSVGVLRVESGEADLTWDFLSTADYARISQDPNLSDQLILIQSFPNIAYATLNVREAPLSDVRVRQALNMAVDRERLVQVMGGLAVPLYGMIPPIVSGYNPDLTPIPYDPEGAKALLAEAGYPDGFSTTIHTVNFPNATRVAEALAQDLGQVGVQVELITLDIGPLMDLWYGENPGEIAIGYFPWGMDYPDPSNAYEPLLLCGAAGNPGGYCNEEMDAMFEAANALPPGDARWKAFQDYEIALQKDYPVIFMMHTQQYFYRSDRVTGLVSFPSYLLTLEAASVQ